MENKVIIKIMQEPKEWPCGTCKKECRTDELDYCKKINDFNKQIIAKEYNRREAIEVMAKAIRNWEFPYSPRQIGWEDLSEDTKDDYKNMAQAALNALLEGVKKCL